MVRARNLFYVTFALIGVIAFALALSGCNAEKSIQGTTKAPASSAVSNEATQVTKCNCQPTNSCQQALCSANTDYQCKYIAIEPCCGNGKCESNEDSAACPVDCEGTTKEFQQLLDNSARVTSGYFSYYEDTNSYAKYQFKGAMIKQIFLAKQDQNGIFYDTILYNTSSSKAYAYCTSQCVSDKYFEVSYSSNFATVPLMPNKRLAEIKNPVFLGDENVEGHPAYIVQYKLGSDSYKAKVWQYYGAVMRIEQLNSDNTVASTIVYKDIQINNLKDSDVSIPSTLALISN